MDFKFTEEQELLKNMFNDFVGAAVQPVAAEIDEQEKMPDDLIPQMGEIGMLGVLVPETYGGVEMGFQEYAIEIESVSKGCASTGACLAIHNALGCWPIVKFGTDEQKEKYLPELASGEKVAAFALTEPGAGSDPSLIRCSAEEKEDCYVLNGGKVFITNGEIAGTYIVFAVTDKTAGKKGISAFIVEKGWQGFTFGSHEKKMGIRGSSTCELVFDNVKVPKENMLGKPGEGYKIAMTALDGVRIGIAAQACGIAQNAIDSAITYTKDRNQFGQTISSFEYTQFVLAELQTKLDAARLLVYRAAALKDNDQDCRKEAAMAKLFASETAMDITCKAVQLYGGYGYTRDYPVERMMRDAKITELYAGTSEVQRIVISRSMGL